MIVQKKWYQKFRLFCEITKKFIIIISEIKEKLDLFIITFIFTWFIWYAYRSYRLICWCKIRLLWFYFNHHKNYSTTWKKSVNNSWHYCLIAFIILKIQYKIPVHLLINIPPYRWKINVQWFSSINPITLLPPTLPMRPKIIANAVAIAR